MGAAHRRTDVDVADLQLVDAQGQPVPLGSLPGVHVVVLMRHRH